jgi:hypothetical protein
VFVGDAQTRLQRRSAAELGQLSSSPDWFPMLNSFPRGSPIVPHGLLAEHRTEEFTR